MKGTGRYVFQAMGSECALCFGAPDQTAALAAELEIDRIEQRYSRYLPDSVLARINRVAAIGGSIELDAETAALLDFAFICHRKSNGLFDITSGILRRAWDFSSGQVPEPVEVARWLPHVGLDKLTWERPVLTFPRVGMELDESAIPVQEAVRGACELLGLDPLYVANEGKLVAIVDPNHAEQIVAAMRAHPLGQQARVIGKVTSTNSGLVMMRTSLGTTRIVDMLSGDQLPRIC